MEIWYEVRLSY